MTLTVAATPTCVALVRPVPTVLIRHSPSFTPGLPSVPPLSLKTWEEPTCTEARRRNEPQQHAAWRALAVLRTVVCGWWFCVWVCRAVGPGPLLLAVPGPAVWCVLGGVLLSRTLAGAVPSALSGLASGFGMGPGVSLSL